ncbi:hypothetical protein C0989_011809 [Termitomyces sp. Mn162]|nr:hypothetical protein C0989_011809 [Termitomyces sp. Mn162]
MQEILGRLPQVNSPSTAAPPAPTLPSAAPPLQGSSFVPPIAGIGVNGAYSSTASLSLRTRFPDVDAAVIGAIISHDFKAADLHKLDPVNRDKETAYTFNGATNQFEVSHRVAKEYKTPFSVLIPLQTYFSILSFHTSSIDTTGAFFDYTSHLLKLVAEYEWTAVYSYHSVFFNRRRADMAAGDYAKWSICDNGLMAEHVYGHRRIPQQKPKGSTKSPSNPGEACRKFNDGRCTTSPCPWGRPHACATCGKADHGKHQHKD